MLKKDSGVIIRSSRSGSSSKAVTFLGRASGKIRLIAKGALKKESPHRGALEPGNLVEVVFYFKDRREMFFLKEASIISTCAFRDGTLHLMAAMLAGLEIVDQITYSQNPDPKIVDLLEEFLSQNVPADPLLFFLAFETRLLGILGALPEFDRCSICSEVLREGIFNAKNGVSYCRKHRVAGEEGILLSGEVVSLLKEASRSPLKRFSRINVDESTRKNFGLVLHWTYTYHVQGYELPNSLKLLK